MAARSDDPERRLLENHGGIADVLGSEFASQLRALIVAIKRAACGSRNRPFVQKDAVLFKGRRSAIEAALDVGRIQASYLPGMLILRPDVPETAEGWPFFWGENEHVVNMDPLYIAFSNAAADLQDEERLQSL